MTDLAEHSTMPRLFTYTIPIDDGAAPNPFRGMCSLAICKPGIRRVAKTGDWVAGLGSRMLPAATLADILSMLCASHRSSSTMVIVAFFAELYEPFSWTFEKVVPGNR